MKMDANDEPENMRKEGTFFRFEMFSHNFS
jgi:hypothetical protein